MSLKIECRKSYKSLCDNEKQIIIKSLSELYDFQKIVTHMILAKSFDFDYIINILKRKDTILAFCIYKRDHRTHTGTIYHVDTLYSVDKGKGYGSQLLDVFSDSTVQLECQIKNRNAQTFYEKVGLKKRAYSYSGNSINIRK